MQALYPWKAFSNKSCPRASKTFSWLLYLLSSSSSDKKQWSNVKLFGSFRLRAKKDNNQPPRIGLSLDIRAYARVSLRYNGPTHKSHKKKQIQTAWIQEKKKRERDSTIRIRWRREHGLYKRNLPTYRVDKIRLSAHLKGHAVLRTGARKQPSSVRGCNKSRLPLFRMIAKNGQASVPTALITALPLQVSHLLSDWELNVSCTVGDDHQINSASQMSRTEMRWRGKANVPSRIEAPSQSNNKNWSRPSGRGKWQLLTYHHHSTPQLPILDFTTFLRFN